MAVFAYHMLFNFILANHILHNHLFLEMIGSITSGLIKCIFTSSRGVVKNPQFRAQFCCASVSAFRRYLLKKKVPKGWTLFREVKVANPKRFMGGGEDLTFVNVQAQNEVLCQEGSRH